MISVIRNTELGLFEIIASGWRVFKNNFISILIIILLTCLPVDILAVFNSLNFWVTIVNSFQKNQQLPNLSDVVNVWSILFLVLQILFIKVAQMCVMVIAEQYILQNHTAATSTQKALSALKKGFSRFGAMLVTNILFFILLLLIYLLFTIMSVILGVIFGTIFDNSFFYLFLIMGNIFYIIFGTIFEIHRSFFLQAVVLRKQVGLAALSYSKSVVQGRWWKVFFLSILLVINHLVIALPLYFLTIYFLILVDLTSYSLLSVICIIIIRLFMLLLTALWIPIYTILFLNLDMRRN
jgi:hypothetical protein